VFGQPHRDAMPLKAAALEAEMLAGASRPVTIALTESV
jgi:hypothetical protein